MTDDQRGCGNCKHWNPAEDGRLRLCLLTDVDPQTSNIARQRVAASWLCTDWQDGTTVEIGT